MRAITFVQNESYILCMNIFFTPHIEGNLINLTEEESGHCHRVLRMKNGDKILITNGAGSMAEARIVQSHAKSTVVEILESKQIERPHPYYLHMAVAPTKNIDRFEWFVEKACEIGIDELTPILTEHSERKILKAERIQNILVSAMKQSQSAWLPVLNPLTGYSDFMKKPLTSDSKLIAHCIESEKWKVKDIYAPRQTVTILIGPEGDFSPKEVKQALEQGFREITLGDARLRTETAAVVACHSISFLNF